jgi:hypothetical protein
MTRFRAIDGVKIPLTEQEEIKMDEDNARWLAGATERSMSSLREKRNPLLASSDWTQYTDSPLDDEAKASWTTYRQQLRDLPATTDDPANPTWPVAP